MLLYVIVLCEIHVPYSIIYSQGGKAREEGGRGRVRVRVSPDLYPNRNTIYYPTSEHCHSMPQPFIHSFTPPRSECKDARTVPGRKTMVEVVVDCLCNCTYLPIYI